MKWRIDQQQKKLDDLFKTVQEIQDEELQAYLSKFLCIRTSGLVESSVKNLIADYLQGSSPKPIQNYVQKSIKSLSNLRDDKLIQTLRKFSPDWGDQLDSQLTDQQRTALNSVISNRNNIAHGETDNISFGSMSHYYDDVKDIINVLRDIIRK